MALILSLLLLSFSNPSLSLAQPPPTVAPPPLSKLCCTGGDAGRTSVLLYAILFSSGILFFLLLLIFRHLRVATIVAARPPELMGKGLEKSVVDSFPIILYKEVKDLKLGREAVECAVCLCEFGHDDALRLLPGCCHVFHPGCIGLWFDSRTTCPVCRADLNSTVDDGGAAGAPPVHIEIEVEENWEGIVRSGRS